MVGPDVAAMPDAHPGNGSTIGSVIPTKGGIVRAPPAWTSAGHPALETQLVISDELLRACA